MRRGIAHLEQPLGQVGGLVEVARLLRAQRELADEIGVVGVQRQCLVDRLARRDQVAELPPALCAARGEQRHEADPRPRVLLLHLVPGAVEEDAGPLELGERQVLRAEVEPDEGGRVVLGFALQQLDVAASLVAAADAALEIAVVQDADRCRLEALRQVARHVAGLLLVDAALEAVLRAVAPHAQLEVAHGRAGLVAAGVVGEDDVERLTPGAAGQLAQLLGVLGHEVLVGVEVDDPVGGRGGMADVTGVGERAVPREVQDASAERLGDLDRTVGRAGVDDDDLVDGPADRLEAAGEHLLLVLDDHAQRERQPARQLGPCGDVACPHRERAQRDSQLPGQRHGKPALLALAGRSQVLLRMRQRRIEADGSSEQRLRAADLAELVVQHAERVEQRRLHRVALKLDGEDRGELGEEPRPATVGQALAAARDDLSRVLEHLVGALAVAPVGDRGERRAQVIGPADPRGGGDAGKHLVDRGPPVVGGAGELDDLFELS